MKIWNEEYKPKNLDDIPHPQATLVTKDLITKKKPILLHGPTGVGKTTLVYTLARELDYEIVEINASNVRDKDNINKIVGGSTQQESLFKKNKIVLIDEIDSINRNDRGCIPTLVSILPKATCPVILTALDINDPKIKALKTKCNKISLDKVDTYNISKIIKNICKIENITYTEDAITLLANKAQGDIRAAINDLQAHSTGNILDSKGIEIRDIEESSFVMLRSIFKSKTLLDATMSPDKTSMNLDESMMWIEENIPSEYKSIKEISKAYDFLSKADVFKGRIRRRQNWSFMVYQKHLMTSGVMSARDQIHTSFTKYQRNTRPLKIWLFNQKHSLRKEIAHKIASHVKASKKDVIKNFPLYKIILKNNNLITTKLKLTDEELYYISN